MQMIVIITIIIVNNNNSQLIGELLAKHSTIHKKIIAYVKQMK
jgi:hypothetical protein